MKTTPTEFKIETGVPIRGHPKNGRKYPFRELEMKQSFFVPFDAASYSSVATCASAFKRSNKDYNFTCKMDETKGVKGTRVWRIPVEGKK